MSLRTLFLALLALNLVVFAGGQMGWLGSSGPRGEPERLTNQMRPDAITLGKPLPPPDPAAIAPPPPLPEAAVAPPPVPAIDVPAATEAASVARIELPVSPPAELASPPQVTPAVAEETAVAAESPVAAAPPAPAPEPRQCVAYVVQGQGPVTEAEHLARTLNGDLRSARRTLEEATNWRVRIPPARNVEVAEQRLRDLRTRGVTDLFLVRAEGPDRWSISLGLFSTEAAASQRLAALKALGVTNAEIQPGSPGRYRIEFRGPAGAVERLATRLDTTLGTAGKQTCR